MILSVELVPTTGTSTQEGVYGMGLFGSRNERKRAAAQAAFDAWKASDEPAPSADEPQGRTQTSSPEPAWMVMADAKDAARG